MAKLLDIAKKPLVTTQPSATVQEAVDLMARAGVGALLVMEEERLVGLFSERDLINRVVSKRAAPDRMKVSDVMTKPVTTADSTTTMDEALRIMHKGNFRHLPVKDEKGKIAGMISIRDLLRHRIEELDLENKTLAAFISADGMGG